HGSGGERRDALWSWGLSWSLLELLAEAARGRRDLRLHQRQPFGVSIARRSVGADYNGRPGHRNRAVPRLPAGARAAQSRRPGDRTVATVLWLPASGAGFYLC